MSVEASPPPPPPPAHQRGRTDLEMFQEMLGFLVACLRGDRRAIQEAANLLGASAAFGAGVGAICAISQCVAIGTGPAWVTYGKFWLRSPLFGAAALVGLLSWIFLIQGAQAAVQPLRALLPARVRDVSLAAGVVLALVIMVSFLAYKTARQDNPLLVTNEANTAAGLGTAVDGQQKVLSQLAASGTTLLERFDELQESLRVSRSQLSDTLKKVRSQASEAEQSAQRVAGLVDRQRQIELRLEEMQRLLDGRAPITRADLEASSRSGMLVGFVLGFASSLAASFAFRWLAGRRRRGEGD